MKSICQHQRGMNFDQFSFSNSSWVWRPWLNMFTHKFPWTIAVSEQKSVFRNFWAQCIYNRLLFHITCSQSCILYNRKDTVCGNLLWRDLSQSTYLFIIDHKSYSRWQSKPEVRWKKEYVKISQIFILVLLKRRYFLVSAARFVFTLYNFHRFFLRSCHFFNAFSV